jgi:hypothetical protein
VHCAREYNLGKVVRVSMEAVANRIGVVLTAAFSTVATSIS